LAFRLSRRGRSRRSASSIEGVHCERLVNPIEFLGDEKGSVTAVK